MVMVLIVRDTRQVIMVANWMRGIGEGTREWEVPSQGVKGWTNKKQ